MKMRIFVALLLLVAILSFGYLVTAANGNVSGSCQNCTQNETVVASQDPLLGAYVSGNMTFSKVAFGNYTSYSHQRMVGGAYVELDGITYAFDNGSLIENRTHWRNDLPEVLPEVITEEQAKSITGGDSAILVYIDPNSSVFASIKPTPTNPCWDLYVRDSSGFVTDSVVLDATTGEVLGHGVPPPSGGIVLAGPKVLYNCSVVFQDQFDNAIYWFNKMGYPTNTMKYPTRDDVRQYVQDDNVSVFFEVAHGDSWFFVNDCNTPYNNTVFDADVQAWLVDHPKMPFTFLLSCNSMHYTEPVPAGPTFSYAFRKGSMNGTVTIGCCGMDEWYNAPSWWNEISWQDTFFKLTNWGWTVGNAFWQADATVPTTGGVMRLVGDPNLKLVPKLCRTTAYITGETRDVNAGLLTSVSVGIYKEGSSLVATGNSNPNFSVMVNETGECWMRASKNAYFPLDTNTLPPHRNPNYPDYLTLLGETYCYDFEGDYGLVPKACTMSYAMTSVNHWLFPPTGHPEWQLSSWKAMESVHSWQFPAKES